MDPKGESSEPILTIKLPEVAKLTKATDDGDNDKADLDHRLNRGQEDNGASEKADNKEKESSSKAKGETKETRDGNKEVEEVKIDPILLRQKMEEEEREKMQ